MFGEENALGEHNHFVQISKALSGTRVIGFILVGPGGYKTGTNGQKPQGGGESAAPSKERCVAQRVCRGSHAQNRELQPHQMQELRLYVSLTGAVIIVRGASAVGRRGCYRNPMISSKYQLLEIEQSLHMESLMPQTEFYFLLLLLPPPL